MNKTRQTLQDALRDGALLRFGAMKKGIASEVGPWLEKEAERLAGLGPVVRARAYWLWIAGEYVNRVGGGGLLERHAGLIDESVRAIAAGWSRPDTHWLWDEEPDVYLSNLALYYAALRSIGNVYRSDEAQKLCKSIREATFASFMHGKHFVSRPGSDEVWPDIVAAAVPFGLLSAGDLAMLEAVGRLDPDRVEEAEAAGLLSGYYGEVGAIARARTQRDRAAALSGGAGSAFLAWAEDQLAIKSPGFVPGEKSVHGAAGIRFIHAPVGGESPYHEGRNERSPRLVSVGQPVAIRTFSAPFRPDDDIALEFIAGEETPGFQGMRAVENEDGEQYWEAKLPPFAATQPVRYRFVPNPGGAGEASEWYSFEVLRWTNLSPATGIARTEAGAAVVFEPLTEGGAAPRLEVRSNPGGAVSLRLELSDGDSGKAGAKSIGQVSGSCRIGNAELSVEAGRFSLSLLDERGGRAAAGYDREDMPPVQALVDRTGTVYKLRLNFKLTDEERLYGMGERFARMEYRGCELDNYVFNQYKDQGMRTYIPVPVVYSSGGYGFYLQSSLYSVFRFGTVRSDLMQIEADVARDRQALDYWLFAGRPLELVGTFARLTGKPKLPPKWAFGPWMSSNNWDSEREVDEQLARTAEHAIPSTVLVLEQWSDESSFYIFNDAGYETKPGSERFAYDDFSFPAWGRWPDPRGMVERIHGQGIRVLLWQAPVMKFMDGIAHAQRDEDERYMIGRGYAVRHADGSPYRIPDYEWFRGSLVPDFTSPDAAAWWLGKRQYLLEDIGIDGFKTDGGECIYGSQLKFGDGRSGAEMRNEYPNSYIAAFQQFADRYVPGGAITFSRAGYTGAQAAPLHWAGDEQSTFEAFRATLVAGLSCGMSGIPFWGWDLGGFSGDIPTAELYVRSAAMAAFCPVMQYHAESKGQFNMDRTPWNIAERTGRPEALSLYKRFADIRMNLLPYVWEQARVSAATGYPLMRAMLLAYPDDERCADLTTQYLFGDSLLVAPVIHEGALETEVYFPEGRWLPLFGGEVVDGPRTAEVEAGWSDIPVYMRENAVVPLNLGAARELADDVGNAVDRCKNLCLTIFATGRLDYQFEDGPGASVSLSVETDGSRIRARVEVAGIPSATLLFRGLTGSPIAVTSEDRRWERAETGAELAPGRWLERRGEALVCAGEGAAEFAIELDGK
ncbi:TIM-barrel domain-containing protein [Cohnella cellulosilytica]|uniref:TIM-barrel domain-containing protein n=1 Tax=Cohnella cellulosilytica TaxID=986710 RepID=A0ABW2FIM2_9BACL